LFTKLPFARRDLTVWRRAGLTCARMPAPTGRNVTLLLSRRLPSLIALTLPRLLALGLAGAVAACSGISLDSTPFGGGQGRVEPLTPAPVGRVESAPLADPSLPPGGTPGLQAALPPGSQPGAIPQAPAPLTDLSGPWTYKTLVQSCILTFQPSGSTATQPGQLRGGITAEPTCPGAVARARIYEAQNGQVNVFSQAGVLLIRLAVVDGLRMNGQNTIGEQVTLSRSP
jgi:hypothetical protein